jgi:RNA polymerase sigma-70 factor (ECF subfamily)
MTVTALPQVGLTVKGLLAVPARSEQFRRLYVHEYPGVAAYAWKLLRDRDAADEVAQEAFTRLFAKWITVREPRHYLYRITTNLIRDSWSSRFRQRELVAQLESDAAQPTRSTDLAAALAVRAAVEALPVRLRPIVLLHYYADLSVPDVALALDRPAGTVKRQLSEARDVLATQLAGAHDG